jgi:hypothetical protein
MKLFLILCLLTIIKIINNEKITNKEIYNNLRRDEVKRELQEESNIYNLTVTNYSFYDRQMDLFVDSEPELDNNITLLITLYIDKYNNTLGYWTSVEIDVRAYDYYGTGEVFSAYVEDLTLGRLTEDMSLTILNIDVESYNANNTYYISFEERTFYFHGTNMPESTVISYYTDTDDIDSSDIAIISVGRSTSSGISTGAIIGIIVAGVVVLGGIISIIYFCFCRKKEINQDLSISTTSKADIITNPDKKESDIRTLIFETTGQINKSIEIDGDKNVRQMRRMYFKAINRKDLIKDASIFFLYNGKVISIDKNDLVKDIFKKDKDLNKIIVSDPGDKIQKKQKKILCCWI